MKIFGSWSLVSFIRFVVQFAWALMLVTLIVQAILLVLNLFFIDMIPLPAPVFFTTNGMNPLFKEILEEHGIVVFSNAVIRANYQLFDIGGSSVLLISALQIGLTAYILYALTVLKRPLNALALNHVFEPENAVQLRVVALFTLFAAPLKFLYEWFSSRHFSQIIDTEIIQIAWPSFDFTILTAGMVLYIFAEIMKRAATLYEEQKLTV